MTYFIAVSVLLIWVLVIGLMMRHVLKKPVCPECGGANIHSVDMHTCTIIRDGEKVPAAWMYRRCVDCSARLKWDVGLDKWVELEPGEWAEVVRNAEEVR